MNEYIENLHKLDKKEVLCPETGSKFLLRFYDDADSKSIKTVNIPIVIGSIRMFLEADVVKNNILLLKSNSRMSKLGMKIDFTRHEAGVDGQVIKLQYNSTGHCCVPLNTLLKKIVMLFFI